MTYAQELVARYSAAHQRLMNPAPKPPKPLKLSPVLKPLPPPKVELLVPSKRPIMELSTEICRPPKIHEILRLVSERQGVSISNVVSDRRFAPYVIARQMFFYICYHYTRFSLAQIGKTVGGKDHTTVLHGVRVIAKKIAENELWRVRMQSILAELRDSIPAIPVLKPHCRLQCPVCFTFLET